MNLEETYDRIAEDWHRDHSSDTWWVPGTEEFISRLPAGAIILDVGSGGGYKSKFFAERGFQVTGIDISSSFLEIAKREMPAGRFIKLSMMDLDRLEDVFDGVFASASLLHIPKADAPRAVQNMADRVKPGGLLYLAVKEAKDNKPDEAVEKENDYGYEYERFFSYYRMPELEEYLRAAGLTPVWQSHTLHPSGKTVWLQIIGQK